MSPITVMVAGDFGRLHEGHLDHIVKAYGLGDKLYIVTHTDESIAARKSYKPMPLWARVMVLRGILTLLGGKGEIIIAKDDDGKCVRTLRALQPDIFAKGGAYTHETIPAEELAICDELDIQIIYNVGERLNQSRDVANDDSLRGAHD